MSLGDVIGTVVLLIIVCETMKKYAMELFPKDFFYEARHKKKSKLRKWLEKAAFLILGGE